MSGSGERRPRWRRILRRVLLGLVAVVVALVLALLVYSRIGLMAAEPGPVQQVREDPAIVVTDTAGAIVLQPASGAGGTGLVFIPGAKVDPWAYVARLSPVVSSDSMTVVITKPWLHLALFDLRGLDSFTRLSPDTDRWLVGGHSLGGTRACQLAPEAAGLLLLGSYCANDLSGSTLPVLSVAGSADEVATGADIERYRSNLPADADLVTITGASHSSFGDYGAQPGDGTPDITDQRMDEELTRLIGELADRA